MSRRSHRYFTLKEVAANLFTTEARVRKWALEGERVNGFLVRLACTHVGPEYRFTVADVDQFQRDCEAAKLGRAPKRADRPAPTGTDTADAIAALDAL